MQGDVDPKYVCMYVCSGVEWSGVDTHTGGVRGGDLGEGSGVRHASFVMRHASSSKAYHQSASNKE